jgi:hypothetical protein
MPVKNRTSVTALSARGSATELLACTPSRIRTWEMSVCRTDALDRLAKGAKKDWCAGQASNLHWTGFESATSANWATGACSWQASNLHFSGV